LSATVEKSAPASTAWLAFATDWTNIAAMLVMLRLASSVAQIRRVGQIDAAS
jgi:hypothetical protein